MRRVGLAWLAYTSLVAGNLGEFISATLIGRKCATPAFCLVTRRLPILLTPHHGHPSFSLLPVRIGANNPANRKFYLRICCSSTQSLGPVAIHMRLAILQGSLFFN
jgi:hypothetical protein